MASNEYRALCNEVFQRFKDKGDYHIFTQFVKDHANELVLCFRGNSGSSGNEVVIYYKNHIVLKIEKSGKVSSNFDHARYCDDWEDRCCFLRESGFSVGEVKEKKSNGSLYASIGYATRDHKTAPFNADELDKLYEICIKPMIDTFFNAKAEKRVDRFWESIHSFDADYKTHSAIRSYLEKQRQQELFMGMKKLKNGYYFYDMEYAEPNREAKAMKNQPDMLAIRFGDDGKPAALVFVE